MSWTEIIGFMAVILSTGAWLPQLIKIYKTRQAQDLSWGLYIIMMIATFLWTTYGLILGNIPLILANSFAFILTSLILLIKIKNRQ